MFTLQTWRLERALNRTDRAYRRLLRAAEKDGKKELERIRSEYYFERRMIEEELDEIFTNDLLRSAHNLRVPVPPKPVVGLDFGEASEFWRRGEYVAPWLLTPNGVSEVRRAIREERIARHEIGAYWLAWASALTGLLGTAIGFVAVVRS